MKLYAGKRYAENTMTVGPSPADDYDDLQDALDAASGGTYDAPITIRLQPGVYVTASGAGFYLRNSYVTIEGAGPRASVLRRTDRGSYTDTGALNILNQSAPTTPLVGITLRNFGMVSQIDGGGTGGPQLFKGSPPSAGLMIGPWSATPSSLFSSLGSSGNFADVLVENCLMIGQQAGAGVFGNMDARGDVTFRGCEFRSYRKGLVLGHRGRCFSQGNLFVVDTEFQTTEAWLANAADQSTNTDRFAGIDVHQVAIWEQSGGVSPTLFDLELDRLQSTGDVIRVNVANASWCTAPASDLNNPVDAWIAGVHYGDVGTGTWYGAQLVDPDIEVRADVDLAMRVCGVVLADEIGEGDPGFYVVEGGAIRVHQVNAGTNPNHCACVANWSNHGIGGACIGVSGTQCYGSNAAAGKDCYALYTVRGSVEIRGAVFTDLANSEFATSSIAAWAPSP